MKTLLDLGSSANYKDKAGLTPLYVCVTTDVMAVTSQRCVDMLLYDHATLGIMDSAGWTELHQVQSFVESVAGLLRSRDQHDLETQVSVSVSVWVSQ